MKMATEEGVVRKSLRVEVPVERAFSVFVEQMEVWWPASHHLGATPFEMIVVEPRVGGRWYERNVEGQQCDWGTVLAWDPPRHVAFSWHVAPPRRAGADPTKWEYDADMARASRVDVRFEAEGAESTLVELVHSGLERHGADHAQLRAAFEAPNAWSGILAAYAQAANGKEAR